jgi:transcriptional repressor NrdR
VSEDELEEIALRTEESLRGQGAEVTSQQIGVAVLERLRDVDGVAYLRFASVYKGFEDVGDFQREVGLLTKTTEPKRRA